MEEHFERRRSSGSWANHIVKQGIVHKSRSEEIGKTDSIVKRCSTWI